jgi:hypothetical protein
MLTRSALATMSHTLRMMEMKHMPATPKGIPAHVTAQGEMQ